jgi:membrane protease YdiL (CAAX protease family)
VNLKVLLSDSWSIGKSILMGIGVIVIFKIITGIYVQLGIKKFGISIDDLANIQSILFASKQDIEAIISTFGKGTSLLLVGIIAPFYEEVIFRGVILGSCQRYINFNLANIFQAALFSTVHLSLFLFPVFFLFGLFAGIMRKKSGGLLPGLVFHALNNILVLIILFVR